MKAGTGELLSAAVIYPVYEESSLVISICHLAQGAQLVFLTQPQKEGACERRGGLQREAELYKRCTHGFLLICGARRHRFCAAACRCVPALGSQVAGRGAFLISVCTIYSVRTMVHQKDSRSRACWCSSKQGCAQGGDATGRAATLERHAAAGATGDNTGKKATGGEVGLRPSTKNVAQLLAQ